MQTFLTSANPDPIRACHETFSMLDNARLGKQRLEAVQIIKNLFPNHPATKMWAGHKHALAVYASHACMEWRTRGREDNLLPILDAAIRSTRSPLVWPWWFGAPPFVRAHQTKLYYKGSPKWVEKLNDPMRLPYLWPDINDGGTFRVSVAEAKRDDWEIPSSWSWDPRTRIIIPR